MTLDAPSWTGDGIEVARALTGTHVVAATREPVRTWEERLIHGSGGGALGSAVVRFGSGDPASEPWSVVAKLVRRNDAAPEHRDYWRRELDVYESTWMCDRLPNGSTLPSCVGSAETDECAVLVLEDVDFDDRDARSMGWYRDFARVLGRLNGARVAGDAPAWLTRDFLAVEAARTSELAAAALADPPASLAGVHRSWAEPLRRLSTESENLAGWLDRLPVVLSHLDASSRNVARRGDDFVVIDWALTGLAPVGTDLAGLFSITMMHADVPADSLADFEAAVYEGYLTGLRDADEPVDADLVAVAFSAALTLRFGRFLTEVHGVMHRDPTMPSAIAGRPIDEVIAAWEALAAHLVPHAERALAAVE